MHLHKNIVENVCFIDLKFTFIKIAQEFLYSVMALSAISSARTFKRIPGVTAGFKTPKEPDNR